MVMRRIGILANVNGVELSGPRLAPVFALEKLKFLIDTHRINPCLAADGHGFNDRGDSDFLYRCDGSAKPLSNFRFLCRH